MEGGGGGREEGGGRREEGGGGRECICRYDATRASCLAVGFWSVRLPAWLSVCLSPGCLSA